MQNNHNFAARRPTAKPPVRSGLRALFVTLAVACAVVIFLVVRSYQQPPVDRDARERAEIREKKRLEAIAHYRSIEKDFADSLRAQDGRAAATALEGQR